MWQGRPAARQSQRRTWLLLGGIALIAIVAVYLVNGLMSSDPAPSEPLPVEGAGGATGYLSDGYEQLDGGENTPSLSPWGLWGGVLLPLLVVIVCIYVALRGLKYINSRVASVATQTRLLESLDSLSLGQHGAIHLIRIDQRVVAIGAAGQSVTLLTEMPSEQAQEILNAHRQESDARPGLNRDALQPFRDLLMSRLAPADTQEDAPPR